MSYWTYISGVITVYPMGRTQAERRYILDTALDHLPRVTGSEEDMIVHVIQKAGHNSSSSHDEFGVAAYHKVPGSLIREQTDYMLVIEASLRDRMFDETLRELNKWLNRLAKRVGISELLVRLHDYDKELIISNAEPYHQMCEWPSWCEESGGEPCWCEYLMWEPAKDSRYPMKLMYKYYNDPENDAEMERRMEWAKGE